MAGGVLNLAGITVFQANNGIIEIPSDTKIKGVNDDNFLNTASFDVSTNTLELKTTKGDVVSVDLTTLSTDIQSSASSDATALAIALG